MLTSERLRDIEARLAREGRVVAVELAQIYATSEDTIRRDLRTLAAAGRCRRVYGGALPLAPGPAPISERVKRAPVAKRALGAALAGLVAPRSTIFIDAGSTTLACAEVLAGNPPAGLTVITHAPAIAAALAEADGLRLVVLGGEIDPRVGAALGSGVLAAIDGLRVDLALLGACGVDAEAGITAHGLDDAAVKRHIAARAARTAIAADSQKLGTAAPFAVMDLAACDILCVEAGLPDVMRARLAACGVALVNVETQE